MSDLYSLVAGQHVIREYSGVARDLTGNLPPLRGILPDNAAPIVRDARDGVREMVMARWGMPSPVFSRKLRVPDPGVTNVSAASMYWKRWLGLESRCVVPFTSFSERHRSPVWFALDESRPLAFFAGIWTRWTSVRRIREGETTNDIFALLTTEPNAIVEPIQPKAMPVILTSREELENWLTVSDHEALKLRRSLPDNELLIVARGARHDGAATR